MTFAIRFVPSANEDFEYYEVRDQRIILDAIRKFLVTDANVPGKRRERLRPNVVAPWELRIGNHRVFYEITPENVVRILAVGHKVHNDLFIRGKKAEL